MSTCHRAPGTSCTVSFNWLQLSPGWEPCLTADTVMVYHGSCALNTHVSWATKEHFGTYCTWACVPYGGPLCRYLPSNQTILTVWGHNKESKVCRGFYHFFELLSEMLKGIETSELMRQSYAAPQGSTLASFESLHWWWALPGLFSPCSVCCYVILEKSIQKSIRKRKCPWQPRDLWCVGTALVKVVMGEQDHACPIIW